jgi:hypothetical protein
VREGGLAQGASNSQDREVQRDCAFALANICTARLARHGTA